MSHSTRSNSTESVLLGFGSPRPQPRMINNSMFGHVGDAFEIKTLKIGERQTTNTKSNNASTNSNEKQGDSGKKSECSSPVKEDKEITTIVTTNKTAEPSDVTDNAVSCYFY